MTMAKTTAIPCHGDATAMQRQEASVAVFDAHEQTKAMPWFAVPFCYAIPWLAMARAASLCHCGSLPLGVCVRRKEGRGGRGGNGFI